MDVDNSALAEARRSDHCLGGDNGRLDGFEPRLVSLDRFSAPGPLDRHVPDCRAMPLMLRCCHEETAVFLSLIVKRIEPTYSRSEQHEPGPVARAVRVPTLMPSCALRPLMRMVLGRLSSCLSS